MSENLYNLISPTNVLNVEILDIYKFSTNRFLHSKWFVVECTKCSVGFFGCDKNKY